MNKCNFSSHREHWNIERKLEEGLNDMDSVMNHII